EAPRPCGAALAPACWSAANPSPTLRFSWDTNVWTAPVPTCGSACSSCGRWPTIMPTSSDWRHCLEPSVLDSRLRRFSMEGRVQYLQIARGFRDFLEQSAAELNADTIHFWICQRLQRVCTSTVLQEISCLKFLLQALRNNPVQQWLARYPPGPR